MSVMQERITQRLVTFRYPFSLADVVGEQPAGTYAIETIEELIAGLSFIAYRRMSTTITLPLNLTVMRTRQLVQIDPQDLQAAEQRDVAMEARRLAGRERAAQRDGRPIQAGTTK